MPCYSQPNGCLQYHTGIDGRLETFNWGNVGTSQDSHLRNQNYRICIRQEEGKVLTKIFQHDLIQFHFRILLHYLHEM